MNNEKNKAKAASAASASTGTATSVATSEATCIATKNASIFPSAGTVEYDFLNKKDAMGFTKHEMLWKDAQYGRALLRRDYHVWKDVLDITKYSLDKVDFLIALQEVKSKKRQLNTKNPKILKFSKTLHFTQHSTKL